MKMLKKIFLMTSHFGALYIEKSTSPLEGVRAYLECTEGFCCVDRANLLSSVRPRISSQEEAKT